MKLAKDMLQYEKNYLAQGYNLIGGTDEVGRGPLAGPVVVAAVIMPLDEKLLIDGIDDSKKVSEKRRELLYPQIIDRAIAYRIVLAEPEEIDNLNILNATIKCMNQAVNELTPSADMMLVDALKLNVRCETQGIIKGDAKSYNIAAASIIAKVYRDRIMREYSKIYPQYDFESNKGYGTKKHIEALKKYGPSSIHRKSFIRNFV